MKLIIIRHGETDENVANIIQGQLPGRLSIRGIEQAQRVAQRLKNDILNYIYSSDLQRASDTAKEIAKFHKNTPIEFVENLRERNLGEFEGKNKNEVGWDAKDQKGSRPQPINGETMQQVYERAKKFLLAITSKHKNNTVAIVCHKGIGTALIAVITKKDFTNIKTIEKLDNASISTFEIDIDMNHNIICLNCTKHLN